ncbi:unnamed protein product (macronuclear) [Paramecium tetraurelia]|uniref:Uncharacterized protein n=1 Tax=Paramecium tetraurelia TaxID=5888 RepID=A0DQR1_PARTE|nr:uncharacterized protein GSPATT00002778001 [Paramecium tetraurelia]CAK85378.1 unnamed protein product [Paramecium tetraurelia]|eukprot:XP_001452775.1 hypothetical protein (macronuclear) [Paramecium tetraurelia strain d4-2]
MQIRQERDFDCESIKNALRTINQRLNYLQKIIPPEINVEKDPKIPKLNLKKIGIIQEENKQIQKQMPANFGTNHQKSTEQQTKVPFKMRSQSFNNNIGQTLPEQNPKNLFPSNVQNPYPLNEKIQFNNEFDIQKRSQEILNKANNNKENIQIQYHYLMQPAKISLHQEHQQPIIQNNQSKVNVTPAKIISKKSQPNPQINHNQYQHPIIHQQLSFQQASQQYVKVIQNYESSNGPILQCRPSQHHNSRSSSFHNLENYQIEKKI